MSTIKAHLYFCLFKSWSHRMLKEGFFPGSCPSDWSRTDNCFMQNLAFLRQRGVLVCTAVILCRIGLFGYFQKEAWEFLHVQPTTDCFGSRGANGSQQWNQETKANCCNRCCTLTEALKKRVSLLRHLSVCLSEALLINSSSSPAAAWNKPLLMRLLFFVIVIHFNRRASVLWERHCFYSTRTPEMHLLLIWQQWCAYSCYCLALEFGGFGSISSMQAPLAVCVP